VNTGFGGSHMSDLYYYADELILNLKPKRIFIYEGDNDLGQGKTNEQIFADAEKLLRRIRCELPKKVKVYFITPKPSIRRWALKQQYENYISQLKAWTKNHKNVYTLDVWSPMMDEKGELKKDLFIEDELHMNSKGYDLWTEIIAPYVKK
jgi:lysophospholipase L1-like esterase